MFGYFSLHSSSLYFMLFLGFGYWFIFIHYIAVDKKQSPQMPYNRLFLGGWYKTITHNNRKVYKGYAKSL